MTDELKPPDRAPRRRPGDLHGLWRAATAIASIALLTFGTLAVFRSDNEAGAATMLIVAAFFAIVAALGRVPRLKFGDNEIDPSAAYALGGLEASSDATDNLTKAITSTTGSIDATVNAPVAAAVLEAARETEEQWRRRLSATVLDSSWQATPVEGEFVRAGLRYTEDAARRRENLKRSLEKPDPDE